MLDYIVVGFGISGLSLSKALSNKNRSFIIVSDASQKATLAAGGLVNPVMLKTGKLVWNINEFLPYAKQFYASFEVNAFSEYPIHRIFNSVEEQNNHLALANVINQEYVSTELVSAYNGIHAPFKMSKVNGGGVISIQKIVNHEMDRLKQLEQFVFSTFDYAKLNMHSDHVEYDGLKAKHIIFSEGFGIVNNPFFQKLSIQGNKGEYLIIQLKSLQLKAILKNKYFLIPLGDDLYKYGATYNRNEFDNQPSTVARDELQFHLNKMLTSEYTIVDQVAGIRPTVSDKKPIYGTHSKYKNVHVFNGMGSRGLLLAPLLANELINQLEDQLPLKKEIDIKRFKHL
ncbi:NAD(P)/FAD-dependent oxidoreductase [Psychroflexus planctonicus]|uniref:FAD-dependent oxidoreductase n=1 Tax=Psychroflexus planctonicus TaxID=1526575 RepID=A0ABQ1SHW8_9FLAO|nr:FAD-dependent oxidoreductase [Psychroflexus planctonicus]GGE37260.1 FAD-dependent oxidoreductase [Psychroflexus planctonicus]